MKQRMATIVAVVIVPYLALLTAAWLFQRRLIYLPTHDLLLTYGAARGKGREAELWSYLCAENVWRRVDVDLPEGMTASAATSPTRALLYDPQRSIALLLLATDGNLGRCVVYALRYQPEG